jgi:transcriptional regulator with XRE-family HTH domain
MNTDQEKQKNMGELGRTLRALRIKRKWTLKDFEKASGFMIKDVVLGSYERGTRYISVSKLMIIASTYEVPMSTFFPTEISVITRGNIQPVIIDLRKLRESAKSIQSDTTILLQQFVAGVVNIRKDWNGEIISLRNSDLTNLSILTSQNAQDLFEHLRESKLLFDVKG